MLIDADKDHHIQSQGRQPDGPACPVLREPRKNRTTQ